MGKSLSLQAFKWQGERKPRLLDKVRHLRQASADPPSDRPASAVQSAAGRTVKDKLIISRYNDHLSIPWSFMSQQQSGQVGFHGSPVKDLSPQKNRPGNWSFFPSHGFLQLCPYSDTLLEIIMEVEFATSLVKHGHPFGTRTFQSTMSTSGSVLREKAKTTNEKTKQKKCWEIRRTMRSEEVATGSLAGKPPTVN